jgi:phospholipid N-methyltransferase
MNETSRHDAWNAGDSYDAYMGRWSRQIAAKFLDWLDMEEKLDWLEVGCGTGALSESILSKCEPGSFLGVEQSEEFVATAHYLAGRSCFKSSSTCESSYQKYRHLLNNQDC